MNWETEEKYAIALAKKVKESNFAPDLVIAIGNSGTGLGKIMARELDRPHEVLIVQRPASMKRNSNRIIREISKFFQSPVIVSGPENLNLRQKKVLIVDNSTTSGATTEVTIRHLIAMGALAPNIKTASLYYLKGIRIRKPPDYFLTFRYSRLFRPKPQVI
jgi:hypoxanthine phosphoribosyltransferase